MPRNQYDPPWTGRLFHAAIVRWPCFKFLLRIRCEKRVRGYSLSSSEMQ